MVPTAGPDVGAADPALRALLVGFQSGEVSAAAALAAVGQARLLVPVVPSPEEPGEMAWVQTTGRDGRIAMLAFTGTDSAELFDPSARPMPMSGLEVARAAIQTGVSALVVDIAGPARFVVEHRGLELLAGQHDG